MPSAGEDQWFLRHGIAFSTKHAYAALMEQPDHGPHAPLIWTAKIPRKLKVFAWLLFKDRLNTRINLAHKHITASDICPRCARMPEDSSHLFITCPLANRIWQRLGLLPQSDDIIDLWDVAIPPHLPTSTWPSVLLALMWMIWSARNDMDKEDVFSWRSYLSARCTVPM
ncbi:hypothetical protein VPH35_098069 [Triticum aestivum]